MFFDIVPTEKSVVARGRTTEFELSVRAGAHGLKEPLLIGILSNERDPDARNRNRVGVHNYAMDARAAGAAQQFESGVGTGIDTKIAGGIRAPAAAAFPIGISPLPAYFPPSQPHHSI